MVGCLGSTYVSWSAAKPDRAPITIETNGLANEGEPGLQWAGGRRGGWLVQRVRHKRSVTVDVDRYHGQAGSAPAVARACISVVHW